MSGSPQFILNQGLAASAQHDIEAVSEAFERPRRIEVELGRQTVRRRLVGYGCNDRVVRDKRIALKIHLGYKPLREASPEHEKWICAGRQLLTRFRNG